MSTESANPFTARTIFIVIVAGIIGFIAFLLLAAYAPELRSGRDGRAHSLSTSAVGFRGVYDLLEATGNEVAFVRNEGSFVNGGLTIVTIEPGVDQDRLDRLIEEGVYQPTLFILPKWTTFPVLTENDRVMAFGANLGATAEQPLANLDDIAVRRSNTAPGSRLFTTEFAGVDFSAPDELQTVSGKNVEGLVETESGDIVLGYVNRTESYILADPDLLNNQALASPERAQAALLLLEEINGGTGPYRFDLIANGFGGSANLLTLAFEPPFLALTLCIFAAALLAGLQAAFRFGPPQSEPRAIAFGKRALVDNSAELLRLARREHLSSARYAELTREAAVAAIGNPRNLEGEALDRWLDEFESGGDRFTVLAAAAETARSRHDILSAARALHNWRKAVTHEG
ncbi:MAG: hypothetical protein HKN78_04240 [Sphingomonadaceae bacterium]|nr:hypothetical protein [Sphingomonadaceae bacterium]